MSTIADLYTGQDRTGQTQVSKLRVSGRLPPNVTSSRADRARTTVVAFPRF